MQRPPGCGVAVLKPSGWPACFGCEIGARTRFAEPRWVAALVVNNSLLVGDLACLAVMNRCPKPIRRLSRQMRSVGR
jgi:hypothetical protein